MDSVSKKVLVTGGGGFLGNVLCRQLLNKGYQVRCMDNFHKGQCDGLLPLIPNDAFEFVYGDVTNLEDCKKAVQGVDAIVHLAGIVGFPACKRQPALSQAVNVDGTANIIIAKDDSQRLVFASTGSVYGAVEGICTEDSPLNAQSEYGIQKKIAEDMVSNTPNSVSYRFATAFGVSACMRVNLLVNDFCYQALTNKCLTIFQADFRRTFIHIDDIAYAFIFAIENEDMKHKVYNCGSNDLNWTKRELAEYIKDKTDCLVTYGEIGTDADQRDYEVSYQRLYEEGFMPLVNMEDGIDDLLKATPLLQIRHQYE